MSSIHFSDNAVQAFRLDLESWLSSILSAISAGSSCFNRSIIASSRLTFGESNGKFSVSKTIRIVKSGHSEPRSGTTSILSVAIKDMHLPSGDCLSCFAFISPKIGVKPRLLDLVVQFE